MRKEGKLKRKKAQTYAWMYKIKLVKGLHLQHEPLDSRLNLVSAVCVLVVTLPCVSQVNDSNEWLGRGKFIAQKVFFFFSSLLNPLNQLIQWSKAQFHVQHTTSRSSIARVNFWTCSSASISFFFFSFLLVP